MGNEERIDSAVLMDGKLVITLSDDTFFLLTLDQLLCLGVARHRIPEDLKKQSDGEK